MNVAPSNDLFESEIIDDSAGFKVLDSRYIAYVMEALRYNTSGNCEYFLPVVSLECSSTPPQPKLLRLQPSNGNTLFSGVADDLTLIN